MKKILLILSVTFSQINFAQNVGIGTNTPTQKLEVNGNIKTNGLILSTGGSAYDFLMKSNGTGAVGYKKAHGGVGLNYIIALEGYFPSPSSPNSDITFIGQIKLFAGNFAPGGWAFCKGQLLMIAEHEVLFQLIGTMYGGDGETTFAVPDLRGAVPVGPGNSTAGYTWILAEKSN